MILITDIDDVVSSTGWRKASLVDGDFDAYHSLSLKDPPNLMIIDLINAAHNSGHRTIAITGRPEKFRGITNAWMVQNKVKIDEIIMRPDDNFMTSPDLKLHLLKQLLDPIAKMLILEDRTDVTTALRGAGYTVLQVAQ